MPARTLREGAALLLVPRRVQAAAMLALVLAKLAMVHGQLCVALGPANFDDALYIDLAYFISDGIWLGPYNEATLVKGPMYPLWIAAAHWLGIPLLLAQHLLFAFACWITIRALRPLRLQAAAELSLFALLLFDPMTWTVASLRVVRIGIYPALTLLVVATAMGIYTHRSRSRASLAAWSLGLGTAFSAFWMTREEGIWLVPSLMVLWAAPLFAIWRKRAADRPARLLLASVWLGVFTVAVTAVCSLNLLHYGLFSLIETRRPEFREAYGALTRVSIHPPIRYLPVSNATRREIYRVSPAFRELRPHLKRGWRGDAEEGDARQPAGEISAGKLLYALRDAVQRAGYYTSSERAMAYYRRLAREVNGACEGSRLPCGPNRATLVPALRSGDAALLVETTLRGMWHLVRFSGFSVQEPRSTGTDRQLRRFKAMTGERLSTREALAQRRQKRLAEGLSFAAAARRQVGRAYQSLSPWLVGPSLAAWVWLAVRAWRRRSLDYPLVVTTSLALAVVSRVVLLAWVDITMFRAIGPLYLSPAYPLMLLFAVLAIVATFSGRRGGQPELDPARASHVE